MTAKVLTSDRIGGLIWFVFGVAVVYGSWKMDRLESMNIPPATAPGVVPALQGIAFIIFALILLFRRSSRAVSVSFASNDTGPAAADEEGFDWRRLILSWALCATYGVVLLGGGLPYWPLTAGFLFLHLMLLDETSAVPARPTLRRFIIAVVLSALVSTIVTMVFRYVFLVRLP